MDFTVLTTEQRRDTLRNEIANIEQQLWGRRRDERFWRELAQADLAPAVKIDARILNNRTEECRQSLAGVLYDITKLELKLAHTREELASLDAGG